MQKFERQGGVAFFLIYYTHSDQFYYLPFEMLLLIISSRAEPRSPLLFHVGIFHHSIFLF